MHRQTLAAAASILLVAILTLPANALGVKVTQNPLVPTSDTDAILASWLDQSAAARDLAPQATQERTQIAAARSLLALLEARPPSDLASAVAVAKASNLAQSAVLGVQVPAPPVAAHATAAEALVAIAAQHGLSLSAADEQALARLDALPPELQVALARFLDAFAAFDLAGQALAEQSKPAVLGRVSAARNLVLDAAVGVKAALVSLIPDPGSSTCEPIELPPLLALDVESCDFTYAQDVFVSIDAGGDDVYQNNGGGNGIFLADPGLYITGANAAFLDFGGNDQYVSGRDLGINGGGAGGAGFLLDDGGDDIYLAGFDGVNGGGEQGAGFLLDTTGDDSYEAFSYGANGGAELAATGMLLDLAGQDSYFARRYGVNGAGHTGNGFLLDAGDGDDTYKARSRGINGGQWVDGTGFLLDQGGDDRYESFGEALPDGPDVLWGLGTNGGGLGPGASLLFDAAGNDRYLGGNSKTNGGSGGGAVAALVDLAGDDLYVGGIGNTNGFGGYGNPDPLIGPTDVAVSLGLLLDGAGHDLYQDAEGGTGEDITVLPKGKLGAQIDLQA